MHSPHGIVQTLKSITARMILKTHPEVKEKLWGGQFWTKGYYVNTVGKSANEAVIQRYVKEQGRTYQQIHHDHPTLFSDVA